MATITFDTNDSERVLIQLRTLIDTLLSARNPDPKPCVVEDARPVIEQTFALSTDEIIPEAFEPPAPRQNQITITPETTNADRPDVDLKGVRFNDTFCGKAKEPFYGSTKRKGQWKKRQGVDLGEYDNWYASELEKISGPTNDTNPVVDTSSAFKPNDTSMNTASAFTPGQTQPQQSAQQEIITDFTQLYSWISTQQKKNIITQLDVGQAYINAGLNDASQAVQDMLRYQSEAPEKAQELVARIHTALLNIVASKRQ